MESRWRMRTFILISLQSRLTSTARIKCACSIAINRATRWKYQFILSMKKYTQSVRQSSCPRWINLHVCLGMLIRTPSLVVLIGYAVAMAMLQLAQSIPDTIVRKNCRHLYWHRLSRSCRPNWLSRTSSIWLPAHWEPYMVPMKLS